MKNTLMIAGVIALALPTAALATGLSLEQARAVLGTESEKRAHGADKNGRVLSSPGLQQVARTVKTDPGELPRLKVKVGKERLNLPLETTHVFAELSGTVARVDIVQTYTNPFPVPIEAVYVFPLPENSAVDDMKMRIGDRIIEAEIQKRAQAKRTYEKAKAAGKTAALLEQERPNIFTQSVANIAPNERIEISLRVVQTLTYDAGLYEFVFPMVVGPRFIPGGAKGKAGTGWSPDTDQVPDASRITPPIVGAGQRSGHDISLEIMLDAGLPVTDLQTPTHSTDAYEDEHGVIRVALSEADRIPNRDFVLRFGVAAAEAQAAVLSHRNEKGGFFQMVVQPPELDVESLVGAREFIFVVDVSGSMSGAPLAHAKATMRRAIERLRPVDTFNIYTFAGSTARAFEAPIPANSGNIERALSFLRKARAGGGTHLATAVQEALGGEVAAGRHRYVFFLTDGYVGNEDAIFDGARSLVARLKRKGQRARVFGLGVGSSVNRHLLDGLAKAGAGLSSVSTLDEPPTELLDRIFAAVDHRVIEDLSIDWGGLDVEAVYPATLPDLFASRPLVVSGRYGAPGVGTVRVKGRVKGRDFELPVEVELPERAVDHGALPTLWARAKVRSLEPKLWGGHDQETVDAITETGLEFRIVTAFTSFVAVDHQRRVGKGPPQRVVIPVEQAHGLSPMAAQGGMIGNVMGMGGLGTRGMGIGGGGGKAYGRGVSRLGNRKAYAPKVVAAKAVVTGSLSKEIIQRVIRRRRNSVRYCYEKALKSNPTLQGKLVLKLIILATGRVTAKIGEDTLKDGKVAECVAKQAARWRFPKPAGGGTVVVSYPFMFSPK